MAMQVYATAGAEEKHEFLRSLGPLELIIGGFDDQTPGWPR